MSELYSQNLATVKQMAEEIKQINSRLKSLQQTEESIYESTRNQKMVIEQQKQLLINRLYTEKASLTNLKEQYDRRKNDSNSSQLIFDTLKNKRFGASTTVHYSGETKKKTNSLDKISKKYEELIRVIDGIIASGEMENITDTDEGTVYSVQMLHRKKGRTGVSGASENSGNNCNINNQKQKQASKEVDDFFMDGIRRSLVEQNVTGNKLPKNSGGWSTLDGSEGGIAGNSLFVLKDNTKILYRSKSQKMVVEISGKELKQYMQINFGTDGVVYHRNEPDFEPFMDCKYGVAKVDIRDMDYNQFKNPREIRRKIQQRALKQWADKANQSVEELKKYMEKNDLTIHECGYGHRVIMIPTIINEVFKHLGGTGIEWSMISLNKYVKQKTKGAFTLQTSGLQGTLGDFDLENAQKAIRKKIRNVKKEF